MTYPVLRLANFNRLMRDRTKSTLSDASAESMTIGDFLKLMTESEREEWFQQKMRYSPTQGRLDLRESIAKDYSLDKEQVVIFSGAQEGIFCVLNALLSAGDHVIVVKPTYEQLFQIPVGLGCQVSSISLKDTNSEWVLDLNEIEDAIQDNTKLIIMNFPNNPTGANITQKSIDAIIAMARMKNIYILSDEVLSYLPLSENLPNICIASHYEKGISLNTLSKSWGLSGIRVGWVCCQEKDLIYKILTMLNYLSICSDATGEYFAYIAYENKNIILAKNKHIIKNNIDYIKSELNRNQLILQCHIPNAGCVTLLKMPTYNTDDLVEKLANEKQILAIPGSLYGLPPHYIRLGLGKEDFPTIFNQFLEIL